MPALRVDPTTGEPHIHTWVRGRRPDGKKDPLLYICAHPDCTTKQNKYDLIGKRSLCSACGKVDIILTREDLRRAHPRCLECSDTIEAANIREKKRILEEMGIE